MTIANPSPESPTMTPQPGADQRPLIITRVFDAPRALVFQAWTDPQHLARWWGPNGFTTPLCELDVRPGGAILIHMQGPDNAIYPMKGLYREVVAPERIVYTNYILEDEDGQPQLEVLTTLTFAEHAGQTTLTVQEEVVKATPAAAFALAGMEEGMEQSLDKLTEYLETGTVTPRPPGWRTEAHA